MVTEQSMRDNILTKIQKMLKLSSNNPNENEAASAAINAKRLMEKYNISMAEINKGENYSNVEKVYCSRKSYHKWEIMLANELKILFPVKMVVERHANNDQKIIFLGDKTDVAIAIEMFEYLTKTIKRLARPYKVYSQKKSFVFGCVHRLVEKFEEEKRRETESPTEEDENYAVILVGKESLIDKYMADNMNLKKQKTRATKVSGREYGEGYNAAGSISLNKQI